MKRYGLSLRFVLLCIVCMLAFPVGSLAEDKNPFADSNDVTITKNGDITTIDLQNKGHTITSEYIQSSGDVIIQNGTISGNVTDMFQVSGDGKLTLGSNLNITNNNSVIWVLNGGKMIIDGASIDVVAGGNSAAFVEGNGSSLNIKSGSLNGYNGNHVTLSVASSGDATIDGGKVTSTGSTTIVARGPDTVITINDGEVSTTATTGYVAGYAKGAGKIIINGGKVSGVGWCALSAIVWNMHPAGTIEINGGTIIKAVGAYEASTATLKITGGTIGEENNNSWAVYVAAGAKCDITGGTINGYAQVSGNNPNNGTLTSSGGKFSLTISTASNKVSEHCFIKSITENSKTYYYIIKKAVLSEDGLTATGITYGDPLGNSILSCTLTFSDDIVSTDEYTLSWQSPDLIPNVASSDTTEFIVVLKMNDATKYIASTDKASGDTLYLPVTLTVNKASLDYTVPTDLTATYGQILADVALPEADNGTWSWADSTDSVGDVGTNTFSATFTPKDAANYKTFTGISVDVTVTKADSSVTTTPAAITGLVYDGTAHKLVTAGEASGGTVQYALGDSDAAGTYGTAIPEGTDAGEYHVWYKVAGDDNHNDKDFGSITVKIAPLTSFSSETYTNDDVEASPGVQVSSSSNGNSTTATTTSFVIDGVQVLSAEIAITVVSMDDEKDFAITTDDDFSRTVSVDVTITQNASITAYNAYAYSMDITGLPEGITVNGTLTSTDESLQSEYHHAFVISGKAAAAGENVVSLLATITISGDAPDLVAEASKDISLDVSWGELKLTGLAAAITTDAITASRGTASSTPLGVTVTGSYNDGSTATLEAGSYSVAWTTASVDVAGISLDEAGNLSVTAIAPLNVYYVPVAATVTAGELSAQASGVVTITVSNAAPSLDIYATVRNASGDTSYSTGSIIARVGDSVDIRVYDSRSTESISWTGEGTLPAGLASSDSTYSFRITGAIALTADLGTYTYTVTASNDIGSADLTISIRVEEAPKQQLIVAVDDVAEVITVTADADTILNMPTEQLIEALTATTSGSSSGSGGTGSETKTAKLVLTSNVAVNEQTLSAIVEKLNYTGVQNIELDLSSVVGLTAVDLSSTKNTSITTLTIGSDNTEIKSVNVENNSVITTVNLAGSGVREVKANGSTITEVNVEGCAELEELDISDTEVGGQLNLSGCGSLLTLNTGGCGNLTSIEGLKDCAKTLKELDVNGNSLLELNLQGFEQLTNPKLYGQKRNNWVQTRRFSLWDFFRSLSMWIAEEGEETAQAENYADKVKILSAEDSLGQPVTWTIDDEGNVEFSRTPTTFKYDFDTGLAQTEVGAPEFMASANEMMDVTISTENPTDDITKPGESSSGGSGGCNAGFGLLALAVMAFTKRKN